MKEALWQLICLCRCWAVTQNQRIFNRKEIRTFTEKGIEGLEETFVNVKNSWVCRKVSFKSQIPLMQFQIFKKNLKVEKCIRNRCNICTEVCTSQIKMNYWKNRESSIKSKVLNWQPDILFRKEVEFSRKLFLCDLSNFLFCRCQPVKKCSVISACILLQEVKL